MQENEVRFTQDIYSEHLTTINGINFTPREIDVISCLLSARRTSQIASILSIAPRTVTTHFRNIMLRLGCNSQEGIISFIERSGKLHFLREYYRSLIIEHTFEKSLQEIFRIRGEESFSDFIIYVKEKELKNALMLYFKDHLMKVGIRAEVREQNPDQAVETPEQNCGILLLTEKQEHEPISEELLALNSVDLSEQKNYYFAFFEILSKLLPNNNLQNIFKNFRERSESMTGAIALSPFQDPLTAGNIDSLHENRKEFPLSNIFVTLFKKRKKQIIANSVLVFSIFCIGFLFFTPHNAFEINQTPSNNQKLFIKDKWNYNNGSINKLPHKNEYFKGREEFLKNDGKKGILVRDFSNSNKAKIAIIGPPGIGKTQLAKEFAIRNQDNYQIVWWFDCKKNLEEQYAEFARELNKKLDSNLRLDIGELGSSELVDSIKNILSTIKVDWLLVFDDVQDKDIIKKHIPEKHNSEKFKGHILITSFNNNMQYDLLHLGIKAYKLNPMNLNESLELLRFIIKRIDFHKHKANFIDLANLLGNFPLALSQAAFYIQKEGINIPSYVNEFKNKKRDLWKYYEMDVSDYDKTVFTTFSFIIDKIKKDKFSYDLLSYSSFLNPNFIPKEFLQYILNVNDQTEFNKILSPCFQYFLLEYNNFNSVSMHQIIQRVIQTKTAYNNTSYNKNIITSLLSKAYSFLGFGSPRNDLFLYELPTRNKEYFQKAFRILPSIEVLLEYAKEYGIEDYRVVYLHNFLSQLYFLQFNYMQFKKHADIAREILEKIKNPLLNQEYLFAYLSTVYSTHIMSGFQRDNIEILSLARNELEKAIHLISELPTYQNTQDLNSTLKSEILLNLQHRLGGTYIRLGRREANIKNLDKADLYFNKAIDINKKVKKGFENIDVPIALKEKGYISLYGEYAEACIRLMELNKERKSKEYLDYFGKEALDFLNKADKNIRATDSHEMLPWIYKLYIKLYFEWANVWKESPSKYKEYLYQSNFKCQELIRFNNKIKEEISFSKERCAHNQSYSYLYKAIIYFKLGHTELASIFLRNYFTLSKDDFFVQYDLSRKAESFKQQIEKVDKSAKQNIEPAIDYYLIISAEDDERYIKGGIGIYTGTLCNTLNLVFPSIKITWFTLAPPDGQEEIVTKEINFSKVYLAPSDRSYSNLSIIFSRKIKQKVDEILKVNSRARIIIEAPEMNGLLATVFRDLKQYPNILRVSRVHSPILVSAINQPQIKEKEIRIKNEEIQLLNSDILSAPSRYVLDNLKAVLISKYPNFGIKKLECIPNKIIPNPINNEDFYPHKLTRTEAVDLIKKSVNLKADESDYNIFVLGRVEERKGIHIILSSVKYILQKIPQAHFYFFGHHADGNIASSFLLSPRKLIEEYKFTPQQQEHIHFVGYINSQLLPNIIHAGDIFPICAFEETFSYSSLEFGLSQVPIFYIRKGALPEIIQENALAFDGKNINELSKRVSELIVQHYNDPKLFIEYAEKLRSHILDKYLSDPTVYNIIDLYNNQLIKKESENEKLVKPKPATWPGFTGSEFFL